MVHLRVPLRVDVTVVYPLLIHNAAAIDVEKSHSVHYTANSSGEFGSQVQCVYILTDTR